MAQASRLIQCGLLIAVPCVNALKFGDTGAKEAQRSACQHATSMHFEEFVEKYGRTYAPSSEEYDQRRHLFEQRTNHIATHNCASDEKPWEAGINHLIDWTDEELKSLRGFKKAYGESGSSASAAPTNLDAEAEAPLPEEVDWGHLESVQASSDQGQCGSCWAYAATTVLRAQAEINNKSHKFSVSQVVACTPNPRACGGSGGCDGATAELAYEYILQAGLMDESSFPALPGGGQRECPAEHHAHPDFLATGAATKAAVTADGTERHMLLEGDPAMRGGQIGMLGWTKFPENKELPLARALAEYGPIAVAVSAGFEWNWYRAGILTPEGCDREFVISHAVVLYGYGNAMSAKVGPVRYWRIKNSWGPGWGEGGNLRLQRLDKEEEYCGWDRQPEVGSGCKGGPAKVWVCGSCGILYDTVMPHFRV